jgi:hypothetical protein
MKSASCTHPVGQLVRAAQTRRIASADFLGGFQAGQQPVAQGGLLKRFPGWRIPAALVLGALDQADVAVAFDQVDATLHDAR